jgi:hypothetical protein
MPSSWLAYHPGIAPRGNFPLGQPEPFHQEQMWQLHEGTMRAQRPEDEILLCCARRHLDADKSSQLMKLLRRPIDWEGLFRLGTEQGMSPLLCWHLGTAGSTLIPRAVFLSLKASLTRHAARNLAMSRDLLEILQALESEGIPALPYKGPVSAAYLYGNPALRTFLDLDVVVSEHDLRKAKDTLAREGYRSAYGLTSKQDEFISRSLGHFVLSREGSLGPIELHWRFAPPHLRFTLNPEDVWARSERLPFLGKTVPAIAADDLLPLLCMHGAKHLRQDLEGIAGIAELTRNPGVHWEAILQRTRRLGCERALLFGLRMARDVLDASLPDSITKAVDADPVVVQHARRRKQNLFTTAGSGVSDSPTSEQVFQPYPLHDRLRDRVLHLYHSALTPTMADWSALHLRDFLLPFYRLLRPIRLGWKYCSRLVGGSSREPWSRRH